MLDGFACATDHRLPVAVHVRNHHIAGHGLQDSLDFFQRSKNGRHAALIFWCKPGHFTAAGAHCFECVSKRKRFSCQQGSVFAQAVPHSEVGRDAVSGKQPGQRKIGRENSGLSNGSLAQIIFGLSHSVGVSFVHEDKIAERLAQQRRHDAIRLGKGFGHNRFGCAQWLQHVYVLRALPGIQERYFGCGTVTAENALRAQRLPHRRLIRCQGLERIARFHGQVVSVSVVNGQAFERAQVGFSRSSRN